ncbi:MAG: hypothetical protein HY040_11185 [Planctomycetes bacterium]|nr:hypothetical protein [Planctomycetota bacterium]
MKPLSLLVAAFACALLACTLCPAGDNGQAEAKAGDAQKPPPKPTLPFGTPAAQVDALIKQHAKAVAAFRVLWEAAKSEEEQAKLERLFPDPHPYSVLLLQIAEKNPKEPAAVDALVWVFENRGKLGASAKAILIRDHLMTPKIGPLCLRLRHESENAENAAILRRVLADNPSKEAQAQAAMGLAKLLQGRADLVRGIQKSEPKDLPNWEKRLGKDAMVNLKGANAADLEKEAEDLFERIRKDKDFAETSIPYGDGKLTLGQLAGRELFEMRHLQPGKLAPDIVGEDIDGQPMKLSDFRGKVVLLDFWGLW